MLKRCQRAYKLCCLDGDASSVVKSALWPENGMKMIATGSDCSLVSAGVSGIISVTCRLIAQHRFSHAAANGSC